MKRLFKYLITMIILFFVYEETGIFTLFFLGLLFIGFEIFSFLLEGLIEKLEGIKIELTELMKDFKK